MEPTGGDGDSSESCDKDRSGRPVGNRVAELAGLVPSPALHCAIRKARASVKSAGRDSGGTGNADGRYWRRRIGRGAVAELAPFVRPPAPHGPVLKEGTAIERAEVDGSGTTNSCRRELLSLADRDGGIRRSDGDGLRGDLGVDQSTGEHNDSYRNAEICFSVHR